MFTKCPRETNWPALKGMIMFSKHSLTEEYVWINIYSHHGNFRKLFQRRSDEEEEAVEVEQEQGKRQALSMLPASFLRAACWKSKLY